MAERENLDWIYSIYDYRDPLIKRAIWLLKYKGKKSLSKVFATSIYLNTLEEISEMMLLENFKNPILIPIPLSKKRYRERGYNQAELIARELLLLSPETFTLKKDILTKIKDTIHQAHIKDRKQRLKNITNSFNIKNKESIKNRNIILIDDVTTTGATLSEAKKVLKENGAKKIIAFTVAH
ncbi:MAG: ComF family protein [Patescibacteria group bacterium]